MYPAFLCSRKPPAGRVGAYRIRSPHTPRYGANACSSCSNTVSSSFKHDSNVIQIRPCGPSVRAYAIRPYSGTRIMYPAFLAGVPDASGLCRGRKAGRVSQKPVPSKLRRRPASAEAGKLAGYLKARTKQTSPASADAPRARKVSKHAAERFRGASGTPAKLAGSIQRVP